MNHANHARYLRLIRGESRSRAAAAARTALLAGEMPYRAAVALRNRLFDHHLRTPAQLGRPTISVGNLTAGGTGKTPMVIDLVQRLCAHGHRPAVLLRGYGNDETRELQNAFATPNGSTPDTPKPADGDATSGGGSLPRGSSAHIHIPVEANPDRAAQAADLLQRDPAVTAFVLDDAFQHRQAHRDLDLVLIDATQPFGHDHVLPRGLLREPAANLRRADAVIVTRSDQLTPDALHQLDQRITQLAGRAPIAHAATAWQTLRTETGDQPIDTLSGQRIVAACGIGNPAAFERQLRGHAGELLRFDPRADHHPWQRDELQRFLQTAADAGADSVVTTEKDWVKWQPLLEAMGSARPTIPIHRPAPTIRFLDGESAFVTLLQERIALRGSAKKG